MSTYDTGVTGMQATRFKAVRAEIISGDLQADIVSLKTKWKCGQDIAKRYLDALVEQQILEFTGRKYRLKNEVETG